MRPEHPIRPCDPGHEEHEFALLLRCARCGFQIDVGRSAHPRRPVRDALRAATRRLFYGQATNPRGWLPWAFPLLVTLLAAPAAGQHQVTALAAGTPAARATCAQAGGWAGWLAQVEPSGEFIGPTAPVCVAPVRDTWHVDLGVDLSRTYSIADGHFVPTVIPSIAALFGPFEVHTGVYLHGARVLAHDTHLTWYQRESAERRWSVYASLSHQRWETGQDLNGQVGLRWRVR